MTKSKTVAERLRGTGNASCNANNIIKAVFGERLRCPSDVDCEGCFAAVCNRLADAIEAEQAELEVDVDALLKLADELDICTQHGKRSGYASMTFSTINEWVSTIRNAVKGAKPQLPEGIVWPRFEDGELVRFGDKFINGSGCVSTLYNLHFYDDEVHLNLSDFLKYGEPVKRPEPGVLDADGVPIKAGDTVWYVQPTAYTEGERTVAKVIGGEVAFSNGYWARPEILTHRKPDTFEGVVAEMLADFDGSDSIELDGYFDRLRKLLGGE